jgi:hypothetical protein
LARTRWAWGIWDGAASQGARANASAFGGITYSHRNGNGPAAAQYLSRQRMPPAMRMRPLREGLPGTIYPLIRDGAFYARAKSATD